MSLRCFFKICLLFLFLFSSPGLGEPFAPMDSGQIGLEEALEHSLKNNPDLLGKLAAYRKAELQVVQAYNGLKPTLNITAGYYRASESKMQYTEEDFDVTFNQPIYKFGQVYWNAKAAKSARSQAAQTLRTEVEILLQNVQNAYIQTLLAQESIKVAEKNVSDRQAYLTLTTNLAKGGEVAGVERMRAESSLLSAQEELLDAQNTLNTERAVFLTYMGVRPDKEVTLLPLPALEAPPESLDSGLRRALKNRPEILGQAFGVSSAEAEVKAQGRTNAPTLSLYGEYDDVEERFGRMVSFDPTWQFGLQLTWPLFDGGAAKNASRQAKEDLELDRQQLRSQVRTVAQDVAQAHAKMKIEWKKIQLAEQALKRAEDVERVSTLRFKSGVADGLEVVTAQSSLGQARSGVLTANASYRQAQVDWRRAISADYPVEPPKNLESTWAPAGKVESEK